MDNLCWLCGNAIITPDGFLRCSLNFKLAKEECDKIEYGKAKLWRPEKVQYAVKPRRKRTVRKM